MTQFPKLIREFSSLFLPPLFIIPLSGAGRLRADHIKQNQQPKRTHQGE
jgi:hypothetical protein